MTLPISPLGDADLKNGLAVGFALGHGRPVGFFDEALYNVGQKFFFIV